MSDEQILQEVVTNEKIVEHPTRGHIRLKMPTLEIQRKIDALARNKKKVLREATDTIPDESNPGKFKTVPAYNSREGLQRKYRELGWWTEEQDAEFARITEQYSTFLAQLEILGFESENAIYDGLLENRDAVVSLLDEPSKEVLDALTRVVSIGVEISYADKELIKASATSTEVDDLLIKIEILKKQYTCYIELAKLHVALLKLEAEKNALFADCWQEQLQYYIRLAQVFYCSESADLQTPLWPTIDSIEQESDLEFIKWIFTELQAFWGGLSDDARERLSKYSFTPRLNAEKSSSEESPVQAQSSVDGDSQESKQITSSEVTDTTDPSLTSNSTSVDG